MPTPLAATVAEFREHLQKTGVNDDAALQRHLMAATVVAEGALGIGQPIVERDLTVRVTVSGGLTILPKTPVVSITSFLGIGPTPNAVVANLDVDKDAGIVTALSGWLTGGDYNVTYRAGLAATVAVVPEDLRLAVCIVGKQMWETQRGRATGRAGELSQGSLPDERVPAGFLVPHRAKAIFMAYRDLSVA